MPIKIGWVSDAKSYLQVYLQAMSSAMLAHWPVAVLDSTGQFWKGKGESRNEMEQKIEQEGVDRGERRSLD